MGWLLIGYLDDGGQGQLREANGAGLGVEVLQRQVIQLIEQAVLKHTSTFRLGTLGRRPSQCASISRTLPQEVT